MTIRADIVTVFHSEASYQQHKLLREEIGKYEPDGYTFIGVDNRVNNRGFAAGCNLGAFAKGAVAPIIGFFNPDTEIAGPFLDRVQETLVHPVVITGCRFGKPETELRDWGVTDWVCGAAFFVSRPWFTSVNGFDPQFVWSWEETDLIRQAEAQGLTARSIQLPIRHESPSQNTEEEARYKRYHFNRGAQRYYSKWPRSGSLRSPAGRRRR